MLLILISTTTNLLQVYYVNIASYKTLEKKKEIVLMKTNKGNWVVILDQKLYDNAIQEIISDTSKFEKLNEDQPWNVKLHCNAFYVSSQVDQEKLCEKKITCFSVT